MNIQMTYTRFIVLDALSKHGGWMDAEALVATCVLEDPMGPYGIAGKMVPLGLVTVSKRRIPTAKGSKSVLHWRITDTGDRVLEAYNSGRRVDGRVSMVAIPPAPKPVAPPAPVVEPEPVAPPAPVVEPEGTSATIRELEEEIARLRAQVEKYVPVVVNVPNVGDVELSRAEAHSLLQQLLKQAQGEA